MKGLTHSRRATHTNCNLFICSVCGGVEGSLTSDCPGYEVPYVMREMVYAGMIDFVVDQWIEKRLTDVTRQPSGLTLVIL